MVRKTNQLYVKFPEPPAWHNFSVLKTAIRQARLRVELDIGKADLTFSGGVQISPGEPLEW
jgi:hypothetical protein